jgi:hypothetical protein
MPAARALRYAQSGSTVTPGFDLEPQCHAAPGARGNSGRTGLPAARSQAATRRWPTSLRIPGNHSLCGPAPEDARSGRRASVGPCGRDTPASVGERGSRAHSRHRTRVSSAAGASLTITRALALRRKRAWRPAYRAFRVRGGQQSGAARHLESESIWAGQKFRSENRANGARVRATNTPTRRSLSALSRAREVADAMPVRTNAGLRRPARAWLPTP